MNFSMKKCAIDRKLLRNTILTRKWLIIFFKYFYVPEPKKNTSRNFFTFFKVNIYSFENKRNIRRIFPVANRL